ncbi:hypothetical protein PFISCL1PPCAC_16454, partial [Pristionchus fissidentatus]
SRMSELALQMKEAGNLAFKEKRYHAAIKMYTEALKMDQNYVLFGNRAQAYINIDQYELALRDLNVAITMKNDVPKNFNRRAKCLVKLGMVSEARKDYEQTQKLIPNDKASLMELEALKDKENARAFEVKQWNGGDEFEDDEMIPVMIGGVEMPVKSSTTLETTVVPEDAVAPAEVAKDTPAVEPRACTAEEWEAALRRFEQEQRDKKRKDTVAPTTVVPDDTVAPTEAAKDTPAEVSTDTFAAEECEAVNHQVDQEHKDTVPPMTELEWEKDAMSDITEVTEDADSTHHEDTVAPAQDLNESTLSIPEADYTVAPTPEIPEDYAEAVTVTPSPRIPEDPAEEEEYTVESSSPSIDVPYMTASTGSELEFSTPPKEPLRPTSKQSWTDVKDNSFSSISDLHSFDEQEEEKVSPPTPAETLEGDCEAKEEEKEEEPITVVEKVPTEPAVSSAEETPMVPETRKDDADTVAEAQEKPTVVEKTIVVPAPPTNFLDFVVHFNQLKRDYDAFGKYFLSISPSHHLSIFSNLLNDDHLSVIIESLIVSINSDVADLTLISSSLLSLSFLPRFDLLVLFMNDEMRTKAVSLLDLLPSGAENDQIRANFE